MSPAQPGHHRGPPRVSIVIPVHNHPEELRRALLSVWHQTFQEFEVLVVDDGSTVDLEAVLREARDPRLQVHRHDTNRGAAAARNTGLHHAQGNYIAFLDSDDEWLPTKLEQQVRLFDTLASTVGVIHAWYRHLADDVVLEERSPAAPESGNLLQALLTGLDQHFVGAMSTLIFRCSSLRTVGGFDGRMPTWEDTDLFVRLSAHGFEFAFLPEVVAIKHSAQDRHRPGRAGGRDLGPFARGLDLFWQKHAQHFGSIPAFRRGVSHFYRDYGRAECVRGDPRSGRAMMAKAITLSPSTITLYWWFLLATLNPRLFRVLRYIRRVARRRPDGPTAEPLARIPG